MQSGILLLAVFVLVPYCIQAWDNEWDRMLHFVCPVHQGINYLESIHDNHREDRRWKFTCANLGHLHSCGWSDYVNEWNQPFAFQCPNNGFITGIISLHENSKEDRRHKFKCCEETDAVLTNCYQTTFTRYDSHFHYNVPRGFVLRGITSINSGYYKDRTFTFNICRVSTCSTDK